MEEKLQKSRRGFYFLQRDLDLFEFLFLHRIATIDQIRREVFKISDPTSVGKRLRILLTQGYLERTVIELGRPQYVYYLAEISFRKFIANRLSGEGVQLKSECPLHDIALIDIAKRLKEGKRVKDYLTENAIEAGLNYTPPFPIKAFHEIRPDGAFVFEKNGKEFNIAVEYEAPVTAQS